MFTMTCNDIDLSIGAFVGFICCVVATYLNRRARSSARSLLIACIAAYAALGALIHARNLPAIVVTLGMSFVWQGLAILLLPKPGGHAPMWLQATMSYRPPYIPLPILASAAHRGRRLVRPDAHLLWRDPARLRRQRHRHRARRLVDAAAPRRSCSGSRGLFGVFSGMALVGITGAADAHLGDGYTLLSIAGVILGGGEFVGGVVSPIGAVIGALTLTLASHAVARLPAHPAGLAGRRPMARILIIVLAARVRDQPARQGAMSALAATLRRFPWALSFVGARARLARRHRLYRRHGRRRHVDDGAVAGGVHRHRRRRADVRHHAGARQYRPVAARQYRPRQRRGDEDDGRAAASRSGLPPPSAAASPSAAPIICSIWALRIPPIIATLSSSFIIHSIDIAYGRGLQIKPPPGFADFTDIEIAGVPLLAILVGLFTLAAGVALSRTVYGRSVLAIGQNARAARFAGVKVEPIRFATYAMCGALAGLDGALLAGYFRGANVDIGDEYQLLSIAVVVIGGTSVAGGKANVPGSGAARCSWCCCRPCSTPMASAPACACC